MEIIQLNILLKWCCCDFRSKPGPPGEAPLPHCLASGCGTLQSHRSDREGSGHTEQSLDTLKSWGVRHVFFRLTDQSAWHEALERRHIKTFHRKTGRSFSSHCPASTSLSYRMSGGVDTRVHRCLHRLGSGPVWSYSIREGAERQRGCWGSRVITHLLPDIHRP